MKQQQINSVSNEELARALYRRESTQVSDRTDERRPKPRPIAPPPAPNAAPQQWPLGPNPGADAERERRALFAALSRGTKATLGREPTVSELQTVIEQIERARALISSAQGAIQGRLSIHVQGRTVVFRAATSETLRTPPAPAAGRRHAA